MGPFSEQRQQARAEAVAELLSNPRLSVWAEQYWLRVLAELAHNEDVYNYRVKTVYSSWRKIEHE